MTEETFGPTVTVARVRDADEAVRLANATALRAGGRGVRPQGARRMELARADAHRDDLVNSVIAFASVPALPFGGVGDSGFGRIHGADGLREFTRAKAITRQRLRRCRSPCSASPGHPKAADQLTKVVGLLHGRR